MTASFFFIILGILLGFVLLRAVKAPLTIAEQLIWAGPIGLMLLTLLIFFLALVLPDQDWALAFGALATSLLVVYYLNQDQFRKAMMADGRTWRAQLDRPELIAWLVVLIPWLGYTLMTVPWLLFYRDGNLVSGWINTWGDWAVHLRTSTYFAAQERLSLESPIWSGSQFHYPYLANYLSSLLQRLGLDSARSLTWPTLALFNVLPLLLYSFGRRLTQSRPAGVVFCYIFLLSGGLGVYYLIKDLINGDYFWSALASQPQTYTDMFRTNGLSTNDSIWFMNFIMSEFFPQRAFLAGVGMTLYILYIAWLAFGPDRQQAKLSRAAVIFASILFGALPIVHTHSFVAVSLVLPGFWLYQTVSEELAQKSKFSWSGLWADRIVSLFWFLGPAAIIGSLMFFGFVFDSHQTEAFIHKIGWWVPQPEAPVNPLLYWWRNAGPLIVLGLLAGLLRERYRALLIGGLTIFIVGNYISFQPWQFDNLKILTYWYLLWAIPVAVLLVERPRWRLVGRGLQILLIIILTGAGLADTLSVTVSGRRGGLELATKEGLTFANLVKQATADQPAGLLIAATNHDNPLSLVAGRRFYMGYEGWLWTYGLNDWPIRLSEIEKMYSASQEGLRLILEKNIRYIAIGPQERDRFKVAEEALIRQFPIVIEHGQYRLLRVQPTPVQ